MTISLKRSRAPSLTLSLSAHTHRTAQFLKRLWGIADKGREPGGDTRSESSHGGRLIMGQWLIEYGPRTHNLLITRTDHNDFLIDTDKERTFMCWLHE